MVQSRNRLVDRVVDGRRWAATGETDGSYGAGWRLWIVEGVRESSTPSTVVSDTGKAGRCDAALTNGKNRWKRRKMCPLSRGTGRYVPLLGFPSRDLSLQREWERWIYLTCGGRSARNHGHKVVPLTLRTPCAHKAGAFQYCARLRQSGCPYRQNSQWHAIRRWLWTAFFNRITNNSEDETDSLGQGGDPQWGSHKSCIWITRSRSDKHGAMVREQKPAF